MQRVVSQRETGPECLPAIPCDEGVLSQDGLTAGDQSLYDVPGLCDVLGVILAGGFGRRMGGVGKPLETVAGVPMIVRVARVFSAMVPRTVIAAGPDCARYAFMGLPCLPDPVIGEELFSGPVAGTGSNRENVDSSGRAGPLAGLLAGLQEARRSGFRWVLTCPADVPLVPLTLGPGLMSAARTTGAPVVCAAGPDRWHPTLALVSVERLDGLRSFLQGGNRRVGGWIAEQGGYRVLWPSERSGDFLNVNSPDDLLLANRLASSPQNGNQTSGSEGGGR